MSQKPRNPRYFPNMKARGVKNRKTASWDRTAGVFTRAMRSLSGQAKITAQKFAELSKHLVEIDEKERGAHNA